MLRLNILIVVVLFCAYHYVDTEIDKQKLIEGVINSNCCGGIEAGVHYKETDRKPPEFVRRCFVLAVMELNLSMNGIPCLVLQPILLNVVEP